MPSKRKIICRYDDCWENNSFNQKSAYCALHQKIIRNLVMDLFERVSQQMGDEDWLNFKADLQNTKNIIPIGKLQMLLYKYANHTILSAQEKEFIYETFKSHYDEAGKLVPEVEGASENSGGYLAQLDAKLVVLSKMEKLRRNTRGRKIQELISLDEDGAFVTGQKKTQGGKPISEDLLVDIALTNLLGWSSIWREIRALDIDRNGLIEKEGLEQLLRDQYPLQLEKYSFVAYFKQHPCSYDESLMNYVPIKTALNARIARRVQEQREKKQRDELLTFNAEHL